MKKIYAIPSNTRDLLFSECESRRKTEKKLMKLFKEAGYDEIITPTLEYYDLFAADGSFTDADMFKLTDSKNRLVVLRPDSTVPIGRVIYAKLGGLPYPIRLCYNQNVFRANSIMRGKRDEITECGIELIGAKGIRADLEAVSLASASLRKAVGEGYRLELGSAAYVSAVLSRLPENADRELILSYIADKNFTSLEKELSRLGGGLDAIRRLPGLFGGTEVIDEALSYASRNEAESLIYLKTLCGKLSELGYGDRLMVDLGAVNRIKYYTGVTFRGYTAENGGAVLSGGAYDRLFETENGFVPSVGFSLNVDAANESRSRIVRKSSDVLVIYADGSENEAYAKAAALRAKGKRVEISLCAGKADSEEYAARAGIKTLIYVGYDK